MISRASFIRTAALLAAALALGPGSQAQTQWPSRPVRLIVGFPPGSTPDISARALADALSKTLGQAVYVENKPGASGNIAADQVAKARDDHTLGVLINGNLTSAKMLYPKLPYDPAKDFSLISLLTTAPLVLVAPPNLPGGAAFFAAARAAGSRWNYGSVGLGSVGHLGMELLQSKVGQMSAVHVPYPGNPQIVNGILSGQVQMALVPPGIAMPLVHAGKLRAIGLSGGRSTLVPDVAPLSEAGVHDFQLEVWTALVGPAHLSKAAQQRLSVAVPQAMHDAQTRQMLFNQGWSAIGTSPEGLRSRILEETALLGGIIATHGIKLE